MAMITLQISCQVGLIEPEQYLGEKVSEISLESWSMSAAKREPK